MPTTQTKKESQQMLTTQPNKEFSLFVCCEHLQHMLVAFAVFVFLICRCFPATVVL